MTQLNVKYAHLPNNALIDHVLLKGTNPLAVELAKRFEGCDPDDYIHTCEECGLEEDNLVSAEDKIKDLEIEISRLNKVIENYEL